MVTFKNSTNLPGSSWAAVSKAGDVLYPLILYFTSRNVSKGKKKSDFCEKASVKLLVFWKQNYRLQRWLSSLEDGLLFQRTRVRFLGNPHRSAYNHQMIWRSPLASVDIHVCIHRHTYTKIKIGRRVHSHNSSMIWNYHRDNTWKVSMNRQNKNPYKWLVQWLGVGWSGQTWTCAWRLIVEFQNTIYKG